MFWNTSSQCEYLCYSFSGGIENTCKVETPPEFGLEDMFLKQSLL